MADDADGHSDPDTASEADTVPSAEELLQQCRELLQELEEFKSYLAREKKENTVELRHFKSTVQSEFKALEKLTNVDPTGPRTQHTLRSSNLPFYAAVWAAAKRSSGLVAFNKRFYWDVPAAKSKPSEKNGQPKGRKPKKKSALVDVVACGGEEWIKVSTVKATRLGFEMAKVGWEVDDSDTDSEETRDHDNDSDDDDGAVSLVKVAEDLTTAAKAIRIHYHHPTVRLVLPKITEGSIPAIDTLLHSIRAAGALVDCSNTIPPPQPLHTIIPHLILDPTASFSSTLNIDCTILLALVSDLSHADVHPEEWFHRAILRQIDRERAEPLLPSSLFPALAHRQLVCTPPAARRMREIVATIGTSTERSRTALLMGDDGEKTRDGLLAEFSALSTHAIPPDWQLPICVVPDEVDMATLPPSASVVAEQLSAINASVFLYGWATGRTTITSNRTVAKQIEALVEEYRSSEDEEGPDVWLCPTARSLVGKEKDRRD